MRTDLKVPFAEKDEAKRLGARWDPSKKVWFVQNKDDLTPFAQWLSSGEPSTPSPRRDEVSGDRKTADRLIEGAKFFRLSCDCLPWDGCPKCQAEVLTRGWIVESGPKDGRP